MKAPSASTTSHSLRSFSRYLWAYPLTAPIATACWENTLSESSGVNPTSLLASSHAFSILFLAAPSSNLPDVYILSSSSWNNPPTRNGTLGFRGASPYT